jgi:hypothetical protein
VRERERERERERKREREGGGAASGPLRDSWCVFMVANPQEKISAKVLHFLYRNFANFTVK